MTRRRSPLGNAYDKNCPTRIILDVIGNRWSVLIIGLLSTGAIRFGKIRRNISGISTKVLTDRLRSLEELGLVHREVHPTSPPAVEYSLTELGGSLFVVVNDLRLWAEKNFATIQTARAAYKKGSSLGT